VAAVEAEAERLHWLVDDLLAVARHEGGTTPLPPRPLLLQHWLPGVVDAELRADTGLRVTTSLPALLPPVLADDGALAQVVRNLLRNATRYAADGMPVEVIASRAGGHVTLEILDRGPGIPTTETELVFEPFYRSASAEATGTAAGLGLAAARSLVEAMGGTIASGPRDGGGCRFEVRLPVAGTDDPADAEARA
jgi:two-component system sensor histidine kinase KdpD